MAWSDAARAAAAEARRRHAFMTRNQAGRTSIIGSAILKSRPQIAKDLRAIRAGVGFKSYRSKMAVHEMARLATNTRNAIRQGKIKAIGTFIRKRT